MTPTDDYTGEMPLLRQVDDATAERLLAGQPVPPDLESVATVVRALREVSAKPARPSDALRQQMAAGVFTDGPVYSYRPATGGVVRRVVAAVTTKIAGARLATKLAGAAVVAAVLGTATAGFAGSLPEPVQDGFENVVESVTPYDFSERTGGGRVGPAEAPDSPEPDPERGGGDRPAEPGAGPSGEPGNGGVEGPEVGEDARDEAPGRPTDLPTPAQEAPGQQQRPTAPPAQGD